MRNTTCDILASKIGGQLELTGSCTFDSGVARCGRRGGLAIANIPLVTQFRVLGLGNLDVVPFVVVPIIGCDLNGIAHLCRAATIGKPVATRVNNFDRVDSNVCRARRGRGNVVGVPLLRSDRCRCSILSTSDIVCRRAFVACGIRGGVRGIRAVLGSGAIRASIGNRALAGSRALARRCRLRHGIGNALGALGPHLGRRGAKGHRKGQERYQTALGHAAHDRPIATPRGALALVLKHIHLSPIV